MFEYPKCPACSHVFTDEQLWHGGDRCNFPTAIWEEETFKCPNCGVFVTAVSDPIPFWVMTTE